MEKQPKIISVAIQKGGVGKTTTTINLAAALFSLNKKVLVIDLDPQMSLSTWLGVESKVENNICDLLLQAMTQQPIQVEKAIRSSNEGFDYIPSYLELSVIEPQVANAMKREYLLDKVLHSEALEDYDYILIDCLPSLGTLLVNALTASDFVVIPVQPQKLSLEALKLFSNSFQLIKENLNARLSVLGILPTMVDKTKLNNAGLENLKENYGGLVFENTIPKRIEASEVTLHQKSSVSSKKSVIGQQYLSVAKEILNRLGGTSNVN